MSWLESQGNLPGKIENNPKHKMCAISLRNGKIYEGQSEFEPEEEVEKETKDVMEEKEAKNYGRKRNSKTNEVDSKEV